MNDRKKEYYARIGFNTDMVSTEDKLFACLLVCGYPANKAYQIAYPTKADANSAAALASRKVNSWAVQVVLKHYARLYDTGAVAFPHHIIKN